MKLKEWCVDKIGSDLFQKIHNFFKRRAEKGEDLSPEEEKMLRSMMGSKFSKNVCKKVSDLIFAEENC